MKPFDPNQLKTFKTPKYTGVSLSLLSMFVITAMMVIWDKISEQNKPAYFLNILCQKSLEKPITKIAADFKNEFNVQINLSFFEEENFRNAEYNQGKFDILIADETKIDQELEVIDSIPIIEKSFVFASQAEYDLESIKLTDFMDMNHTIGYFNHKSSSNNYIHEFLKNNKLLRNSICFDSDKKLISYIFENKIELAILPYQTARAAGLKKINLKLFDHENTTISCMILKSDRKPKLSFQFARYMSATDKGQAHLVKNHLKVLGEDSWIPLPSITIYCENQYKGNIEAIIKEFETREGVQIELSLPNQDDLVSTLISISQSNLQNIMPDLLLVSPNTEKLISPNYLRSTLDKRFTQKDMPKSLIYFDSRNKSICKRIIKHQRKSLINSSI